MLRPRFGAGVSTVHLLDNIRPIQPITSAGRFSPLGPVGIFNPERLFQSVVGLKDVDGLAN
jgi:hypothetical protein